jgi:anti-anti-sigma factor
VDIPDLSVSLKREGDRHVLALAGELDLTSAGRLLDAVGASCAMDITELVVDLSALEFLDSSGLRALLDAATVCQEHMCQLTLTPTREQIHPQVRRLLQITGLIERLPFPTPAPARPRRPPSEDEPLGS